jgi:RNA-directed DNA polymerase
MATKLVADDKDLIARFQDLRDGRDVAALLEVRYSDLTYHLYRRDRTFTYKQFSIRKKAGGQRTICAPVSTLKIIQRKLNHILQLVYNPKPCVCGFVHGKSIVTNAQTHVRRTVILNVDLRDFFPSINFGRVRGMFMARPYTIPAKAATVLAQICCFSGCLPQGAPTSPAVSNMICGKLDSDLLSLARRFHCTYTRYADDITFSTTRNRFPSPIGRVTYDDESPTAEIGDLLRSTIEGNGFEINSGKVRILGRGRRQEVTGLAVNKSPNVRRNYVRQLRAIIHAIQKYGYDAAERDFQTRYHTKTHNRRKAPTPLATVMEGKLAYLRMVKGEADPVYRRLSNRYQESLGRPRVYVADPLRDISPALWILESEDPIGQGSAFALREIGLVTCQHVLQNGMHAFQHHRFTVKSRIIVISQHRDLDAAVLRLPQGDHASLEIGDPDSVRQGDTLTLAGFPNYRLGDTPYIAEGRVAGFRIVHTLRWILLSTPIIAGNSGGPVLDRNGRVVGIAATGADNMEDANRTEHHGVIPISVLRHL